MESFSIYIHIPFCRSRCNYCDFITYAGVEYRLNDYVEALCREITLVGDSADSVVPIHTIYFGGGTPSLLSIEQIEKIINTINRKFIIADNLEVTLEANPGTLTPQYLEKLRRIGINRLSLGMQSMVPEELKLLGRQHDTIDVIKTINWARRAGFENINLDLIFGLPGQSIKSWKRSIEIAVKIHPEHFSLYSLTIEPGTLLERWYKGGLLPVIDNDKTAEMYEWAGERLENSGYKQYEISNWAKFGDEGLMMCHHNLQYWKNKPYLGFGAGAHGYASNLRVANVASIDEYIIRCTHRTEVKFPRSPATFSEDIIDYANEMAETMIMGLRLTREGISESTFYHRFGKTLLEMYHKEIDELIHWGLLEWVGEDKTRAIRITKKGRILGNQVFIRFV